MRRGTCAGVARAPGHGEGHRRCGRGLESSDPALDNASYGNLALGAHRSVRSIRGGSDVSTYRLSIEAHGETPTTEDVDHVEVPKQIREFVGQPHPCSVWSRHCHIFGLTG